MYIPWVNLVWEKHYNNDKLPSHKKIGSFWWLDVLRLLSSYNGLATVKLGNAETCFLWDNIWVSHFPAINCPKLHSICQEQTNKSPQSSNLRSSSQ